MDTEITLKSHNFLTFGDFVNQCIGVHHRMKGFYWSSGPSVQSMGQDPRAQSPGLVIPKIQKLYLMPHCLTKFRIKGSGVIEEMDSALPTTQCSS